MKRIRPLALIVILSSALLFAPGCDTAVEPATGTYSDQVLNINASAVKGKFEKFKIAITNGELDGEDHPHVVLLVMDVGGVPTFRCSGTLLSRTVLLTAGHCANNFPGSPYTGMRIFTESDVDNGNNNFPFCNNGDKNCVEAVSFEAHPLYEDAPFFVHDVGVVILKKPGVKKLDEYGTLPEVDELDVLATQRGLEDITFTSVGMVFSRSIP
ncbi:MAG: trypsin-like serine protease [Bacteroidetes bacterium]|nr:trypsin-like serine protease [Bacteroidota bacterium]